MGGGTVALELAVNHPDRLRSVVPISGQRAPRRHAPGPVRPEHVRHLDPDAHGAGLRRHGRDAYAAVAPHPEHFDDPGRAFDDLAQRLDGWSDEQLAGITAPMLIVIGDHDFTTIEHGAVMQELIPGSQLAILPGTTHMQAPRRADLLIPMLAAFLD